MTNSPELLAFYMHLLEREDVCLILIVINHRSFILESPRVFFSVMA